MKALIAKEPITPFVTRVQELYQTKGVSTILVIGGSSEYLEVADRIYMMNEYEISHITKEAKRIRSQSMTAATATLNILNNVDIQQETDWNNSNLRDAYTISTYPKESSTEVVKVSDLSFLVVGDNQIDIRMLHNIASLPQLNAIAFIIRTICNRINPLERFQKFSLQTESSQEYSPNWTDMVVEVEQLLEEIQKDGLESIYATFFTECGRFLDMPRKYEVLAAISRI